MVGQLSLETGVEILPMFLDGAHDILPKGSFVPKGSRLRVHIGPTINPKQIVSWLGDLKPSKVARVIAQIAQFAVEELRDGRVYLPKEEDMNRWLGETQKKSPIEQALDKLKEKYHCDRIVAPRSWYFTLDGKEGKRYTISVDKETISITEGKPTGGKADCVIKTTSDMLSRMILEGYVPSMTEFASGKVKTNAPNLLFEFQKVFQLKEDT